MEYLDKYKKGDYYLPTFEKTNIPNVGGVPSLLLNDLCNPKYSYAQALEEKLETVGDARGLLLLGASGSGKTRTLFSFLSRRRGLYFTATTSGNVGSKDVESIILRDSYLRNRLIRDAYDWNSGEVERSIRLLLVSRLKILEYCNDIPPEKWLILQAACRGLVDSGGSKPGDVFAYALDHILHQAGVDKPESAEIENAVNGLAQQLGGLPTITLDESQILLSSYSSNYFVSVRTPGVWRPLARDFMATLWQPTREQDSHQVVVSGTGRSIETSLQDFMSGISKITTALPEVFNPFGVWTSSDMIDYAKQVLQIQDMPERECEAIDKYVFPRLNGRFRPFATVLELMLKEKWTLMKATRIVERALSLSRAEARALKVPVGATYHSVIEQLEVEPGIMARGTLVRLWDILSDAAVHNLMFGEPYYFYEAAEVVKMIDRGVARTLAKERGAAIDEHLVINSFYSYVGGASWLMKKVLNSLVQARTPTTQGLVFELLTALSIQRMWFRKDGALWEIFADVLNDASCPCNLEKWLSSHRVRLLEGRRPLGVTRPDYKYNDFYAVSNEFRDETMLVDGVNHPGPDIYGKGGVYADDDAAKGVDHVMVTAQTNFVKSLPNMSDAIRKASLGWAEMGSHRAQLCFLVVFPIKISSCPRYFYEEEGTGLDFKFKLTLLVGAENADLLFESEEQELLVEGKERIKRQQEKKGEVKVE